MPLSHASLSTFHFLRLRCECSATQLCTGMVGSTLRGGRGRLTRFDIRRLGWVVQERERSSPLEASQLLATACETLSWLRRRKSTPRDQSTSARPQIGTVKTSPKLHSSAGLDSDGLQSPGNKTFQKWRGVIRAVCVHCRTSEAGYPAAVHMQPTSVEKWMSHFCWKNLLVWIYSRLVCVIPLKTPKISRLPRVVLIAPRPSGTRGRLRPASGPVGKKVSSASSSMTVRLTYCIRHGHCRRPLPSEPKRCYCFKDKGP